MITHFIAPLPFAEFAAFFHADEIPLRIAWGLLHSIWEIALLAFIYWVVSLVLTSRYARLRYVFGYAVLLTMLALPLLTLFLVEPLRPVTLVRTPAISVPVAVVETPLENAEPEFVSPENAEHLAVFASFDENLPLQTAALETPLTDMTPLEPMQTAPLETEADMPPLSLSDSRFDVPRRFAISDFLSGCLPWLPALTFFWFFGVALMAIRLCLGLGELRTLRRRSFLLADGRWEETLRIAAARLGVRRKVALRGSNQIRSPLMLGLLRPMILVPLGMLSQLAPEQVEVILLHELAHVRRHDYLANLVQLLIETLLFYHPLLWWVSRSVRRDREYLCDDMVLSQGKIANLVYAQTLTDLETFRQKEGLDMKRFLSTPAAAARPLLNRVKRIMNMKTQPDRRADCLAGAILLLILAAFPLWAVFSPHGQPSPALAVAMADPLDGKEAKPAPVADAVPDASDREILLEVYPLEKILSATGGFDVEEIEKLVQAYLLQSHAMTGDHWPAPSDAYSGYPQTCKAKGNLLIVMATARHQKQIETFLEKLETTCKQSGKIVQSPEPVIFTNERIVSENPVVETPEGQKEYGIPSPYSHEELEREKSSFMRGLNDGGGTMESFAVKFQHRDPAEFYEILTMFINAHTGEHGELKDILRMDGSSGILIYNGPVNLGQQMRNIISSYDLPHSPNLLSEFMEKYDSAQVSIYTLKYRSVEPLAHFLNSVFNNLATAPPEQEPVTRDLMFFFEEKRLYVVSQLDMKMLTDFLEILLPFIKAYDQPKPLPASQTPVAHPYPAAPQQYIPPVPASTFQAFPEAEKQQALSLPVKEMQLTHESEYHHPQARPVPEFVQAAPLQQYPQMPQLQPSPPAPHYIEPTSQNVLAIPFQNRKAKDFLEMLTAMEDMFPPANGAFADESSNTLILLIPDIERTANPIIREAAVLFDHPEPSYPFADLDAFMTQAKSATVETFPINNRSAEDIRHMFTCLHAAVCIETPKELNSKEKPSFAYFVDESGKTLIIAWDNADNTNVDSKGMKDFLAKYDVPQKVAEASGNEPPQDGKIIARAFQFQNRDPGQFFSLVNQFLAASEASQGEKIIWGSLMFDSYSRVIVYAGQQEWLSEMLQKIVPLYDTEPGKTPYDYKNLADFLAKYPGAKARSFPLKNASPEILCHFLRCWGQNFIESEIKMGFFIDEKSNKLLVALATNSEDIEKQAWPLLAKFVELCDQPEQPMPIKSGQPVRPKPVQDENLPPALPE